MPHSRCTLKSSDSSIISFSLSLHSLIPCCVSPRNRMSPLDDSFKQRIRFLPLPGSPLNVALFPLLGPHIWIFSTFTKLYIQSAWYMNSLSADTTISCRLLVGKCRLLHVLTPVFSPPPLDLVQFLSVFRVYLSPRLPLSQYSFWPLIFVITHNL